MCFYVGNDIYYLRELEDDLRGLTRIDTKLYSLFTIAELFPMARSETFLLKVSTVIAVDEDVNYFISPPYWKNPQMVNIVSDIKTHAFSNGKVKFPCSLIIFSTYPHPLPPPVVRLIPEAFQLERPRISLCWSNLNAIGQSVFE
jgi:hypothetical protein